jgi:hypothetical protein
MDRDSIGQMMVGTSEFIEAFCPNFQIPPPPFMNPCLGFVECVADDVHTISCQTHTNGSLTKRKFIGFHENPPDDYH